MHSSSLDTQFLLVLNKQATQVSSALKIVSKREAFQIQILRQFDILPFHFLREVYVIFPNLPGCHITVTLFADTERPSVRPLSHINKLSAYPGSE